MEKSNIKEMSSFKLNDGSSKTDSKNSDKSQTDKKKRRAEALLFNPLNLLIDLCANVLI